MRTTSAIVSALVASNASAAYNSCSPSNYETMIISFAQGFQADPSSTTSECYGKAEVLADKANQFVSSFTNFDTSDWAAPLYIASESTVAATDVFIYCDSTGFAKQLSTRTSTLAGFFDLFATIGVSLFNDYRDPGSSELVEAWRAVDTGVDCAATVNSLAQTLKYTFVYEVPESYYADALQPNLVDALVN